MVFGEQCCCEAGQTVSERGQLASVPTDIGDSFLGSALEFGGLWSEGCLGGWLVFEKVECSLLNVKYTILPKVFTHLP